MTEKNNVLIVGGGISGVTVALDLARSGIHSILVEREPSLGGLSGSFCCKASETCNKCFACVVDKRLSEIRQERNVSILTETELTDVQGEPGDYTVLLKRRKERSRIKASAVVLAVGIDPFDATGKPEYGYGRFKNVITAKDLDRMLRFQERLIRPSDGKPPGNVAFFQCVGSRDESIGNLYCSQVCCAYALRMIRALRHKQPKLEVTFLYMDIQPAGSNFKEFLNACRQDKGIRLIRSLPSKVYYSPVSDQLRVRFVDPEREEVVEEPFDLIVLSVGMTLKKGTRFLIDRFGLRLTDDGFISPPPFGTGIFVAGACSGPKDVDRSILHAKSTALLVQQYLERRA